MLNSSPCILTSFYWHHFDVAKNWIPCDVSMWFLCRLRGQHEPINPSRTFCRICAKTSTVSQYTRKNQWIPTACGLRHIIRKRMALFQSNSECVRSKTKVWSKTTLNTLPRMPTGPTDRWWHAHETPRDTSETSHPIERPGVEPLRIRIWQTNQGHQGQVYLIKLQICAKSNSFPLRLGTKK